MWFNVINGDEKMKNTNTNARYRQVKVIHKSIILDFKSIIYNYYKVILLGFINCRT